VFCHILLYVAIAVVSIQSVGFAPTSPILDVFLTGLYCAVWLYVPVAVFLHFAVLQFLTSSNQKSLVSDSNEETD